MEKSYSNSELLGVVEGKDLINGQWYYKATPGGKVRIIYFNGKYGIGATYGFDTNGNWSESMPVHKIWSYGKVPHQVLIRVLTNEAVKRGLVLGAKYKNLNFLSSLDTITEFTVIHSGGDISAGKSYIFYNGIWAEPVSIGWDTPHLVQSTQTQLLVLASGLHDRNTFEGTVIDSSDGYKYGEHRTDWLKETFTPAVGSVTLKA